MRGSDETGSRLECDALGEVEIPAGRLWGALTERSRHLFRIGGDDARMSLAVIRALARVKIAAAEVNAELGVITSRRAVLIVAACREILDGKLDDHFPLGIWQTGSGTQTHMNVNEVIANRGNALARRGSEQEQRPLHPNDDVNRSQSTNDVFPTAMHLAAYGMLVEQTLPGLNSLRQAFASKAASLADVVKIGRTHLMDATPLTLGQELSGYASQLDHARRSLEASLDHLSELAIGGTAVGTGLNAPPDFGTRIAKRLAEQTGFPFRPADNAFEAQATHDALVEVHSALKGLATSLMKIACDIRLLASGPRCGLGEIILPANEPGSSFMPGKVNPTQTEAVTMVCARVLGNDTTVTVAGANGQLELNAYKPVMIACVLESARLLGDACRSFAEHCVRGLQPNRTRIRNHLDASLMLVSALTPHVGYDMAAAIAKEAHARDMTLREVSSRLAGLSGGQFDEAISAAFDLAAPEK